MCIPLCMIQIKYNIYGNVHNYIFSINSYNFRFSTYCVTVCTKLLIIAKISSRDAVLVLISMLDIFK